LKVVVVVPGRIDRRTGGSIYDRRMVEALRSRGWTVNVAELEGAFPCPTQAELDGVADVLASFDNAETVVVDGLVFGAIPELLEREAARMRFIALIHLPLAADITAAADAVRLAANERRALATARLVVVTSAATVPMLASYELPASRIAVVAPGTDRKPLAHGSRGGPLQLISVAAVHHGKGHDVLLRALAEANSANWHLTCAGSVSRDRQTVERIRELADALRLQDRVSLVGELDDDALDRQLAAADIFVLATLQETYGMAVAEALARGLPVVATDTGAIPILVGSEAGIVVPRGSVGALAEALRRVLTDAALRARLAAGARRVRERLADWDTAAERMSAALTRVNTDG
jgi:glycosyltransferase involved in cell wall biosynthesis